MKKPMLLFLLCDITKILLTESDEWSHKVNISSNYVKIVFIWCKWGDIFQKVNT